MPKAVPATAIWKVSSRARPTEARRERSGGNICASIRPRPGRPRANSPGATPTPSSAITRKVSATTDARNARGLGRAKRAGGADRGASAGMHPLVRAASRIDLGEPPRILLRRRTVDLDPARAQTDHAIGELDGMAEVVGDEEQRQVSLAQQAHEQAHHLLARRGIEEIGRAHV